MSRIGPIAEREILRQTEYTKHLSRTQPQPRAKYPVGASGGGFAIAKSGGSGIAAISGFTPGSASVQLYKFASGTLSATTTATAYNIFGAVGADHWLFLVRIFGVWWVVAEGC